MQNKMQDAIISLAPSVFPYFEPFGGIPSFWFVQQRQVLLRRYARPNSLRLQHTERNAFSASYGGGHRRIRRPTYPVAPIHAQRTIPLSEFKLHNGREPNIKVRFFVVCR